jgi:four helix bundle protein
MQFDHERLDVYKVSLEFVRYVSNITSNLEGVHRNARDQLIRSSQSIPLNIAEGNGKNFVRERARYFEIARGSAMESAAALDILRVTDACSDEQVRGGKELLVRVVSMLCKLIAAKPGFVREDGEVYRIAGGPDEKTKE